jgi:hypothetical protein
MPRGGPFLIADAAGNIYYGLPVHLPSVILLQWQRCVAAGNGLGISLDTTAKYVRRTASGAAGNGLGTTIKYLRRTRKTIN